jgi:hypothetical protein
MIDTICIGSGGIKGISILSALYYLERNNYINIEKITTYTCVSVGCLIGILLIVGYKLIEICDIIKNTDLNEIKPDLDLDLMIDYYGFDNGEKLINYIKNIVLKKLNYNNDITFLELYKITNKELYIATTNFTKNTEKIFNFKDTPDVSVFLAIRISISIPLIYTPIIFENDYYVDGALINSVYILKESEPEKTLVLYTKKRTPSKILSITDILIGSISIICDQLIIKDIHKYNCVILDCLKDIVFSSELEITKELVDLLFANGEYCAENYLKNKIKNKIKKLKKDIYNKKSNIIKDIYNKKSNIIKDILNNIITRIEFTYK